MKITAKIRAIMDRQQLTRTYETLLRETGWLYIRYEVPMLLALASFNNFTSANEFWKKVCMFHPGSLSDYSKQWLISTLHSCCFIDVGYSANTDSQGEERYILSREGRRQLMLELPRYQIRLAKMMSWNDNTSWSMIALLLAMRRLDRAVLDVELQTMNFPPTGKPNPRAVKLARKLARRGYLHYTWVDMHGTTSSVRRYHISVAGAAIVNCFRPNELA